MKTGKNLTIITICKKCCKIFCDFSITLKKKKKKKEANIQNITRQR